MKSSRKNLLENELHNLMSSYQEMREQNLPPVDEAEEKENEDDSLELNDALSGEIAEKKRLRRRISEQRLAWLFKQKKKNYQDKYDLLFPVIEEIPLKTRLRRIIGKPLVNIAEKIGMGLDDVPAAVSSMLEVAAPFLLSGAGGFVFISKLNEGIGGLYKAGEDKTLSPIERYTLMTTHVLQIAMATAGLAVCGFIITTATLELISSLVHIIPNVVELTLPALSVGLAPLGIPVALSLIAAVELYQASSTFHFEKQKETVAKKQYEIALADAIVNLKILQNNSAALEKQKSEILQALEEKKIKEEKALEEIADINKQLSDIDTAYFTLANQVDIKKQTYDLAHKERIKAERELGFASTEMILSLVVLSLFTMTVLTATGIFSFGAVPGFVLLGVVGGILAIKMFDVIDKKIFDSKGTTAIRNFAIKTGEKIKDTASNVWKKCTNFFSPTPKPGPVAAAKKEWNTREILDQMIARPLATIDPLMALTQLAQTAGIPAPTPRHHRANENVINLKSKETPSVRPNRTEIATEEKEQNFRFSAS